MVRDNVHELAEQLPDYQSSRGAEFRNISVEQRYTIARDLIIARSQANASGQPQGGSREKWLATGFRYHMRKKKEVYLWRAGRLGIDYDEARYIWRNVVYEDVPSDEIWGRSVI